MNTRLGTTEHLSDSKAPTSGLAFVENLFFGAGAKPASEVLQRLLGADQRLSPYATSETGFPSRGLYIGPDDEISYTDFSPPPAWNATYSIQRIKLGSTEKQHFVFHSGEEIFIPISGDVFYHFFFSPGGRRPHRAVIKVSPNEGTIVRINPQIPHHAWSAGEASDGWLILRHSTDSPAALVMDEDHSFLKLTGTKEWADQIIDQDFSGLRTSRQRFTVNELLRPGAYAMIAWGISDAIRSARQKSSLTVSQLAKVIGVDASSLSRLEDAKANVSIELLSKVCRALRIGIGERIGSGTWTHDQGVLEKMKSARSTPVLPGSRSPHDLHPYFLRIAPGAGRSIFSGREGDTKQMSSWILLRGRALVELPASMGKRSILLDAGNVLHFREHAPIQVKALQEVSFLQIFHSQQCQCLSRAQSAGAGPVAAS